MANSWLRLWHEMPNDPKWRTIARVSGQSIPEVLSVYLHLLVDASNADERGRTQPNSEDIASALDMQVAGVEAILKAMETRVIENGHLSGWEKRQPVREDNSAERARKWREINKSVEKPNADERNRTKPNATELQDKDKEEIKNKIKEQGLVGISPEDYANFWNRNRGDLPKVTKFTPSRKVKVHKRIAEGLTMQVFGEVMNLCTTSDFLSGREATWKATFDWIMENDKNWVKVFEGNYINGNQKGQKNEQHTAIFDRNNTGLGDWAVRAAAGAEDPATSELPPGSRALLGTSG